MRFTHFFFLLKHIDIYSIQMKTHNLFIQSFNDGIRLRFSCIKIRQDETIYYYLKKKTHTHKLKADFKVSDDCFITSLIFGRSSKVVGTKS